MSLKERKFREGKGVGGWRRWREGMGRVMEGCSQKTEGKGMRIAGGNYMRNECSVENIVFAVVRRRVGRGEGRGKDRWSRRAQVGRRGGGKAAELGRVAGRGRLETNRAGRRAGRQVGDGEVGLEGHTKRLMEGKGLTDTVDPVNPCLDQMRHWYDFAQRSGESDRTPAVSFAADGALKVS